MSESDGPGAVPSRRRWSGRLLGTKSKVAGLLSSHPVDEVLLKLPAIRPWRHPSTKIRVDAPSTAPGTASAVFWGFYEAAECRTIRAGLPTGIPVVEVGAGIGVISATILSLLRPGDSLTCVEANPALLPALRWNTHENAKPGVQVRIVNTAIAEHPGSITFHVDGSHLGSSVAGGMRATQISVDGLPLSRIVEGKDSFALVSDIEGSEAAFILGEDNGLDKCVWACLELHEGVHGGRAFGIDDLVVGMSARGFSCLRVDGSVHTFGRLPN